MQKLTFIWISFLFVSACAPSKKELPLLKAEDVYGQICGYGTQTQDAKGFIVLRMSSKEVSGQYTAAVKASLDKGLDMTVTHLFGGTLAEIKVREDIYMVKIPSKNQVIKGEEHWGGIPLRWASTLILGHFPCPELVQSNFTLKYSGHQLQILGQDQEFHYELKVWQSEMVWPESLRWIKKSEPKAEVQFKFYDPEDQTGSPLRWEAQSSQGEVKVKWQNKSLN